MGLRTYLARKLCRHRWRILHRCKHCPVNVYICDNCHKYMVYYKDVHKEVIRDELPYEYIYN